MPVPVSTIEPLKVVVPPVRFATATECPALPLIGEAMLMLPLAAPDRSTPSPPALEMFTGVVVPTVAVVTAEPSMPSPLVPETFTPWTSTPFASPTPDAGRVRDHRRRCAGGNELMAVDEQAGLLDPAGSGWPRAGARRRSCPSPGRGR